MELVLTEELEAYMKDHDEHAILVDYYDAATEDVPISSVEARFLTAEEAEAMDEHKAKKHEIDGYSVYLAVPADNLGEVVRLNYVPIVGITVKGVNMPF